MTATAPPPPANPEVLPPPTVAALVSVPPGDTVPVPASDNKADKDKPVHPTDETDSTHSAFVGTTLVLRSSLSSLLPSSPESASQPHPRQPPLDRHHNHTVAVTVDSVVGSGSFSYVYLAHQVQINYSQSLSKMLAADSERTLVHQPLASSTATENARKAVKRLFKEGLDQRQLRLQRHEVLIMNEIGPHSNIVPLIGTVEDEKSLYLVMDYCEMDLYDAITKRGGFSERAVKNIFAQIVDAVIHCHSKGYYHRDLKPENCLIVSKSAAPNDYIIKLTDFGLATSDTWSTEMGCGSVRYMAPECFDPAYISTNPNIKPHHKEKARNGGGMHNPFSSRTGYPPASSDVWSLGVILINLLFAKNPWFEAHPTDPIFSAFVGTNPNILRAQFNLSPHFDALLRRCFDLDPRRRCSVYDLKVLVDTMPRFVGGYVPGLMVPYGPPTLSSKFVGANNNAIANAGKPQPNPNTHGFPGSMETRLDKVSEDAAAAPGIVLAPGEEIPSRFNSVQLRLLLGSEAASMTSPTIPSSLAPLPSFSLDKLDGLDQLERKQPKLAPTSAPASPLSPTHAQVFTSTSTQPQLQMSPAPDIASNYSANPGYPTQQTADLNLQSQPHTQQQEHQTATATLLPRPPSTSEIAVESRAAIHANQQQQRQQQLVQPLIRFPSLRRRLSRSISGLQNAVRRVGSGFFGPSTRAGAGEEENEDAAGVRTRGGGEDASPVAVTALAPEAEAAGAAEGAGVRRTPSFAGAFAGRFRAGSSTEVGGGAGGSGGGVVGGGISNGFFKRRATVLEGGDRGGSGGAERPYDAFFGNMKGGDGASVDGSPASTVNSEIGAKGKGSVESNGLRKVGSLAELGPGTGRQARAIPRRASMSNLNSQPAPPSSHLGALPSPQSIISSGPAEWTYQSSSPAAPSSLQAWNKQAFQMPPATLELRGVPVRPQRPFNGMSGGTAWTPPAGSRATPAWGEKFAVRDLQQQQQQGPSQS